MEKQKLVVVISGNIKIFNLIQMYGGFVFYNINLYIYIYITKYFIKVVLCEKTTFLRTPFNLGFSFFICIFAL